MQLYKKKCTCNKITQTSGGEYQPFNDINNLKVQNSYYAQTELLRTKNGTPNRPSLLLLEDFRFNLPEGARVRNIAIIYQQMKIGLDRDKSPQIGKPTINLQNAKGVKTSSQTGQAPTVDNKTETLNFSCNINAEIVNNPKFAVQFRYPANSNMNEGYFRIYNILVEVSYVVPKFSLSLDKAKGVYNGDEFEIVAKLSNLEPTSFVPMVTINVPIGFTLERFESNGAFEQRSARVLLWYPKIFGVSSDTLTLHFSTNVTYPGSSTSYIGTFDISEAINSNYKTLNVTVLKPNPVIEEIIADDEPLVPDDEMQPDEDNPIFEFESGEYFNFMFSLTPEEISETGIPSSTGKKWVMSVYTNPNFEISDFTNERERAHAILHEDKLDDYGNFNERYYQNLVCDNTAILWAGTVGRSRILRQINYAIYPKNKNPPSISILEVKGEELDRLGDGYNYTVQSFLKKIKTEEYPHDWKYNFRLGVFNNGIKENIEIVPYTDSNGQKQELIVDHNDYDNLDIKTMIKNSNWSKMAKGDNYESVTVEFTYHKEYPLYILVTGDYQEANSDGKIYFTEPCIVESRRYVGRQSNGIYPIPIEATRGNTTSAEETIPALRTAAELIFYNLPLPENYGTNDEFAVQGIELTGTIEKADEMIITAKLTSPSGESHIRSVTVNDYELHSNNDNQFSMGGFGDLWGFNTLDLIELEDWDVEVTVANTINPTAGTINFNNVELTFYVVDVEQTQVKTYINGEDLSYYGLFLRDLKIPEGLNTDLNWIDVNGTDTNIPSKQAIREKTMTLEFDIGESCQLLENTQALRRLTSLLITKRDEYNKPIPNIIRFSHYPDLYWEYILEDTLDNNLKITSYEVKAKLTIPSGTAFSYQEKVSNTYGFVDGLTHINPVITLKPLSNALIITEMVSGQTFNMACPDYENKIIQLNCKNRKAILKTDHDTSTGTDISRYVDLNSDWFRLLGEYAFDTANCIITNIKFRERW